MFMPARPKCNRARLSAILMTGLALIGLATGEPVDAGVVGDAAPKIGVTGNASGFTATHGSFPSTTLTVGNNTTFYQGSAPLLPSALVGPYVLTVQGTDSQGNSTSKMVQINYQPASVQFATGKGGVVSIPGMPVAFTDSVQRQALTSQPMTLENGTLLSGTHGVWAASQKTSTVSVTINGVEVDPGQMVQVGTVQINNGVLSLPAMATTNGSSGSANIVLMTDAPSAPIVQGVVNVWNPNVTLSAGNWNVTQAVTNIGVVVRQAGGGCTLSTDPNAVQKANMIDAPLCYLNWNQLPTGLTGTNTGATGRLALSTANQVLGYQVSLYNGTTMVQVGQGSQTFNVSPANAAIAFSLTTPMPMLIAGADNVSVGLNQTLGAACTQNLTLAQAQASAQAGALACLIQWTQLPTGLSQDANHTVPWLTGVPTNPNTSTITWSVAVVNASGTTIPVSTTNYQLAISAPVAPLVAISGVTAATAPNYVVPYAGGQINFSITASDADTNITIVRDGTTVLAKTVGKTFSPAAQRTFPVTVVHPPEQMWNASQYTVTVAYANIAGSSVTQSYTINTAPDLVPLNVTMTLPSKNLVDNGTATATVNMVYGTHGQAFDPTTMGQWNLTLVQYKPGSQTAIQLTQPVPADRSGTTQIPLDLAGSGVADGNLIIGAVATLNSSVAGYSVQKTSLSQQIAVVNGANIPGALIASAAAGKDPFTPTISFVPTSALQTSALGPVTWQVSSDGGTTWQSTVGTAVYRPTLTAGNYLVQASTINKFSQAGFTTPSISISSYDIPTATISAPVPVLIGQSANMTVAVDYKGQALTDSQVVVEWEIGTGVTTWTVGTLTTSIPTSLKGTVPVKARVRLVEAPDAVAAAWVPVSSYVQVYDATALAIGFSGPTRAMVGSQATWNATINTSVRGLTWTSNDSWSSSNGTSAQGDTLQITPTESDLSNGQIVLTFQAQIQGLSTPMTVSRTLTVPVIPNIWPNWSLYVTKSAPYAPATVQVQAGVPGMYNLSNYGTIKYAWTLPPGIAPTVNAQRQSFTVTTPGDYTLSATMNNDLGNTSTVTADLNLPAPPPIKTTLNYTASNTFSRAPLVVRVTADVTLGHPQDRLMAANWTLDGDPYPTTGGYVASMTLPVGDHTIGISGTSQLGFPFSQTLPISVVPDTAPTCTITEKDNSTAWVLYANCVAPTGRVVGYQWLLNGNKMSTSAQSVSIPLKLAPATVQLTALDDAGTWSTPITWTNP